MKKCYTKPTKALLHKTIATEEIKVKDFGPLMAHMIAIWENYAGL
jgi:hypothetical protein